MKLRLPAILLCLAATACGAEKSRTADGPRLLFSPDEVPALRAKAKSEAGRELHAALQRRADQWLALPDDSFKLVSDITPRIVTTQVTELAAWALIGGESRHAEKAVAILCRLAGQHGPDDSYKLNQDLAVGNVAQLFALGYDLTRSRLDAEQDRLLRAKVEQYGQYIHDASTTGKAGATDAHHFFGEEREGRYLSNWNTVTHGNLGLCALVLGDRPQWLARAEERVAKYLELSNDATGAPYEGAAYMGYGKQNALLFIHALKRATGRDLLAQHGRDHTSKIGHWLTHQLLPGGGRLLALNQSNDIVAISDFMPYLNAAYQDRLGHWAWLRLYGNPEKHGGSGTWGAESHPGQSANLAYSLVWLDPALQPLSPAGANLPLSARFERGEVTARSGWKKGDSFFSVSCGRGVSGVWNHADESSFTFASHDFIWATDLGAGWATSACHNTLMVDGTGQDTDGGPNPTQGQITRFEDRGDSVLVECDPSPAYRKKAGLTGYSRVLIYGRAPHPYLIVVDRPVKHGEANWQWNLFTGAGVRIEAGEGRAALLADDASARCDVRFFWPAPPKVAPYTPDERKLPAGQALQASLRAESPELVTVLLPATPRGPAQAMMLENGSLEIRWPDGTTARVPLDG